MGISQLIQLYPHLEYLDLHYFHIYNQRINVFSDFRSERILQHVVELSKLPKLIGYTLGGLLASGEDLLDFVARTKPRSLSLQVMGCHSYLASLQDGCERLQRDQGTIRQPVSFSVSKPIFIGSPGTAEYKRRQCLEYG